MSSFSQLKSPSPTLRKPNPYLTQSYLITLSSHIETLSSFYQLQTLPSLSSQYKSFLQSTFKTLSDSLTVFAQDQTMLISSMLSTKVELEAYVGQKLFYLLEKETGPLADILRFVIQGYKKNVDDYEELLLRERRRKVECENEKNDRVVNNLKKEVLIKREYVKELQQRIRDLQQENSNIYQKIIDNAKNTISSTLIQTKNLTNSQQFLTPGKYSKQGTVSHLHQGSPAQMKISHKQLSLKQVEQTILQILSLKRKQQSISQKRTSMKSYIKYYFKYKFGLSGLCEEMRNNFVSAVRHFLMTGNGENSGIRQETYSNVDMTQSRGRQDQQQQQKPLLLMFQKMVDQQIDQAYYCSDYIPRGIKIIKIFKRYLHEKSRVEIKQLDRLYDGYQGISGAISNYSTNKIMINEEERKDFQLDDSDVKHILCNVYAKSKQVQILQMIFAELIGNQNGSPGQNDVWMGKEQNSIILPRNRHEPTSRTTVLSKHLLGIILCYEIESYSMKLTPLTNAIRKHSLTAQWAIINYTGLQKLILQLKIQQERYLPYLQQNYQDLKDKEFTYSEVVEIIDGQICSEKSQSRYASTGQIPKKY